MTNAGIFREVTKTPTLGPSFYWI